MMDYIKKCIFSEDPVRFFEGLECILNTADEVKDKLYFYFEDLLNQSNLSRFEIAPPFKDAGKAVYHGEILLLLALIKSLYPYKPLVSHLVLGRSFFKTYSRFLQNWTEYTHLNLFSNLEGITEFEISSRIGIRSQVHRFLNSNPQLETLKCYGGVDYPIVLPSLKRLEIREVNPNLVDSFFTQTPRLEACRLHSHTLSPLLELISRDPDRITALSVSRLTLVELQQIQDRNDLLQRLEVGLPQDALDEDAQDLIRLFRKHNIDLGPFHQRWIHVIKRLAFCFPTPVDGVPFNIVRCPSGWYPVGSSHIAYNPLIRSGLVHIKHGFWISDESVSCGLWDRVMDKESTTEHSSKQSISPSLAKVGLSWYDAVRFCNRLSALEGYTPAYTIKKRAHQHSNSSKHDEVDEVEYHPNANGYRLPFEYEWEIASNSSYDEQRTPMRYHSLNVQYERRSYLGLRGALKQPNFWGLKDMQGLHSEWCNDAWHLHVQHQKIAHQGQNRPYPQVDFDSYHSIDDQAGMQMQGSILAHPFPYASKAPYRSCRGGDYMMSIICFKPSRRYYEHASLAPNGYEFMGLRLCRSEPT